MGSELSFITEGEDLKVVIHSFMEASAQGLIAVSKENQILQVSQKNGFASHSLN